MSKDFNDEVESLLREMEREGDGWYGRASSVIKAQCSTIDQLKEQIVSLEIDVDRMAWKISPAMAQATIDQLVKRNEQLEEKVKALTDKSEAIANWHEDTP